ncbi:MAG: D-aminoacyl-tRNA deacylase, partial [Shewanella sp.]
MIALIQRVSRASVVVDNQMIGEIDKGLLVLLGVEQEDTREKMEKLATKVM